MAEDTATACTNIWHRPGMQQRVIRTPANLTPAAACTVDPSKRRLPAVERDLERRLFFDHKRSNPSLLGISFWCRHPLGSLSTSWGLRLYRAAKRSLRDPL
jgi:hypothetical protein